MSRYIDADAIDKAFSKLRFNNDGELEHYGDRPNWYLWGSDVENLIANAPSIDIVRCKECKKANTEDCSHSYWDDDWGEWRVGYKGDEWFCADGERSEE